METAYRSKKLFAHNKAYIAKMQVIWLTRSGVLLETSTSRMNLVMLPKSLNLLTTMRRIPTVVKKIRFYAQNNG